MRKFVYCTFQTEGMHKWPEAEEEGYLQDLHRHMFHVTLWTEVRENNREIEFIALKRLAQRWLRSYSDDGGGEPLVFGSASCEDLAEYLVEMMRSTYGERTYGARVSEDGENGAIVRFP